MNELWRSRLLASLATLTVVVIGLNVVLQTLDHEFRRAAQLLILAGILDGLDGALARYLGGTTKFGARLDTYVDTVSFGVAPAVLTYQVMTAQCAWPRWFGAVVASLIVISGVVRFTRGCDIESRTNKHRFLGLPIPVSAVWMALLVLMVESRVMFGPDFRASPWFKPLLAFMWVCALTFIGLQVSNVKYTKPSKRMMGGAMVVTLVLMAVFQHVPLTLWLCMCAAILCYVALGPFLDEEGYFGRAAES